MRVFYLDSFFILNLCLDYLLIVLAARLSNISANRARVLISSVIGSIFAVWMFFLSCDVWICLLFSIGFAWLIISVAFCKCNIWKRMQLVGILCMESFVFSGLMMLFQNFATERITVQNGVVYVQLEFWQIIVSAILAYIFLRICFRDHVLKIEKQRLRTRVELNGIYVETILLVDSGNLLREPLSGKSVILMSPDVVEKILPYDVSAIGDMRDMDMSIMMDLLVEHNIIVRVLPLHTVTGDSSMTLAFKADRLLIEADGRLKETTDYWIGIAKTNIDICGGCRGLIGI